MAQSGWAERRVVAWQELIAHHRQDSELVKVRRANEFLNQMRYVEDRQKWGQSDYWATPREFVTGNGGDCEDFAIAKYFTLRAMGVPEARMQLVYALTLPSGEPHMVLYFYPENQLSPVVLDNRDNTLKMATNRADIHPVYSFNRQGYWLNEAGGNQKYLGASTRLGHWNSLLKRRDKENPHN
ncbi:MAG: transglutaminase-like cysteine peptidase, partial [Thiohalophilus sp.]